MKHHVSPVHYITVEVNKSLWGGGAAKLISLDLISYRP